MSRTDATVRALERERRRRLAIALGVAAAACLLWVGVTRWLAPTLIVDAYHGRGLPLLDRLISGQANHAVEAYLEHWTALSAGLTTLLAAVLGLGLLLLWLNASLRVEEARRGSGGPERGPGRGPQGGTEDRRTPAAAWPGAVFGLAAWIGLLSGLAETLYLGRKLLFGEWVPVRLAVGHDFLWMTPLAYAVLFAGIALLLYPAARRWPRIVSPAAVTLALAGLGAYSVLQAASARLATYAAVLLAIGLAVQLARLARGRPGAFLAVARRSAVRVAAALVLLAVAVEAYGWAAERRAAARLPAARAGLPNVLLIILDTVRAQSLGLYGYERETTPELERLAGTGVVFDRAVAPSSWTLPSHATFFTGRHLHEHGADWKVPLDDRHPTLAEVLAARGYRTGGFVGNFYYAGEQFGLDRGFQRYEDQPRTPGMVLHSAWLTRELAMGLRRRLGNHQDLARKRAEDVNRSFLSWLGGSRGRPFFAFLNYFDAHAPYLPPEPYGSWFTGEQPRYWLESDLSADYSASELQELRDAYDGSIRYVDAQLGRLLEELRARDVLDRTLVIVTSDHGEEFGEHAPMGHANSLYIPLLHVPLVLSMPGRVPAGRRVEAPVTLRDLPATVTDLLGLECDCFPGSSLAAAWAGSAGPEPPAAGERATPALSEVSWNPRAPAGLPVRRGSMKSVIVGDLHYILNGDGAEELYDLAADPWEQQDLAGTEEGISALMALRERLSVVTREPAPPAAAPASRAASSSWRAETGSSAPVDRIRAAGSPAADPEGGGSSR